MTEGDDYDSHDLPGYEIVNYAHEGCRLGQYDQNYFTTWCDEHVEDQIWKT